MVKLSTLVLTHSDSRSTGNLSHPARTDLFLGCFGRVNTITMKFFASVVTVLIAVSSLDVVLCDEDMVAERPSLPHGLITISSLVTLPTEFAEKDLGLSDSQFSEIKLIRKNSELLFHEIAERFSSEGSDMQAESDIGSRIAHAAHTLESIRKGSRRWFTLQLGI